MGNRFISLQVRTGFQILTISNAPLKLIFTLMLQSQASDQLLKMAQNVIPQAYRSIQYFYFFIFLFFYYFYSFGEKWVDRLELGL